MEKTQGLQIIKDFMVEFFGDDITFENTATHRAKFTATKKFRDDVCHLSGRISCNEVQQGKSMNIFYTLHRSTYDRGDGYKMVRTHKGHGDYEYGKEEAKRMAAITNNACHNYIKGEHIKASQKAADEMLENKKRKYIGLRDVFGVPLGDVHRGGAKATIGDHIIKVDCKPRHEKDEITVSNMSMDDVKDFMIWLQERNE